VPQSTHGSRHITAPEPVQGQLINKSESSNDIGNFVALQIIIYCWPTCKLTTSRISRKVQDHLQNLTTYYLVHSLYLVPKFRIYIKDNRQTLARVM